MIASLGRMVGYCKNHRYFIHKAKDGVKMRGKEEHELIRKLSIEISGLLTSSRLGFLPIE